MGVMSINEKQPVSAFSFLFSILIEVFDPFYSYLSICPALFRVSNSGK